MKKKPVIRWLFALAALYDGALGVAFLFAAGPIYRLFGVPEPNHFAYVQFPAALLVVFALMFASVATDPGGNRNLIPYGVLLKVSYAAVVILHWLGGNMPGMWKPFALIDVAMALLFVWAYGVLGRHAGARR